jgi:hypothetical protein
MNRQRHQRPRRPRAPRALTCCRLRYGPKALVLNGPDLNSCSSGRSAYAEPVIPIDIPESEQSDQLGAAAAAAPANAIQKALFMVVIPFARRLNPPWTSRGTENVENSCCVAVSDDSILCKPPVTTVISRLATFTTTRAGATSRVGFAEITRSSGSFSQGASSRVAP